MPCVRFGNAIICYDKAYKYKGLYFCFNEYTGPYRLNKDGEPSQRSCGRQFFKLFNEWLSLPEKEKFRAE